jgi:hypothetical protein
MQQAARCAWGDDIGMAGPFHDFIPTTLAVIITHPASFYIFSF